jgi:hypothetical protein
MTLGWLSVIRARPHVSVTAREAGWSRARAGSIYIYRSCSCAKKIAVAISDAKRDIFALSSTDHGYCFYKNSRLCYVANACHPNLNGFLYGVLGSCGLPYRWFQGETALQNRYWLTLVDPLTTM